MARKIRKRPHSFTGLVIKLLIPWAVMGIVAFTAFSAGYSDLVAYGTALASALAVTFLIPQIDRRRRSQRTMRP